MSRCVRVLGCIGLLICVLMAPSMTQARVLHQHSLKMFSSSRLLLLRPSALPAHYHYKGFEVVDSVRKWDGGIGPIVKIDIQNGWMEAAQEAASDPKKKDVMLSVQLFRTAAGANADFGQFFTNAHPETIYEPGAAWLGGVSLSGYGSRATLYRTSDTFSLCPDELTADVSFVYLNGIFSVGVCLHTVGERAAKDLAKRLLSRATYVASH